MNLYLKTVANAIIENESRMRTDDLNQMSLEIYNLEQKVARNPGDESLKISLIQARDALDATQTIYTEQINQMIGDAQRIING